MKVRTILVLASVWIMAVDIVTVKEVIAAQLVSPEVHADRRVTFRLRAPMAKVVMLQGISGLKPQSMKRNSDGDWEITVGPLAPELYSYTFNVDRTTLPDPHNRHVKKWLSVESLVEVPGDPPLLHEQCAVPHGVVHHHWYDSSTTRSQRGVFVYTPPEYAAARSRAYPLLLLLHGFGDDESAWTDVGRVHYIMDNLLAQEKAVPMVIAMPYGHPLPVELRSDFDDYASRNMKLMTRDMLTDLLPFLQDAYHVSTRRQDHAIVGLSMGGGQSLTIGLHHLDQFAWIGGFSSAAPEGELDKEFSSLLQDVAQTNGRVRLLWIGCGKDDFLRTRNQTFVKWLLQHRITHTFRQSDGGHEWPVWRNYIAEFLPLLFRSETP